MGPKSRSINILPTPHTGQEEFCIFLKKFLLGFRLTAFYLNNTSSGQCFHLNSKIYFFENRWQCRSFRRKIALFLGNSLSEISNKFFEKKVGTQKIRVPTSVSISVFFYSSSSRLVWSLWVAGAVLEDFFSVVVEVATAETLSLPATFIT